MLNINYQRLYYIFIGIVITLFDQFTKYFIHSNYKSFTNKDLIIFTVDNVKNYGAAFNIFSGGRIFLSVISTSITIILVYFILKKNNLSKIDLLAYSFILGGTLGNGLDRIKQGYVIDFINLNFVNFPVFNIADISINIGFILIFYTFIKSKK